MEWWSTVVEIAAQWLSGDDESANGLMIRLKNMPAQLMSSEDPLPKYANN